jgi:phosphate transport system substrate-binding protein
VSKHRNKWAIALATLAVIAGTLFAAAPAGAVPPADNTSDVLTGVGSDVTYWLMKRISAGYSVDRTFNSNAANPDRALEVPPFVNAPFDPITVIPAQGTCSTETRYDGSNPPPGGGTAGKQALVADTTNCIDYARTTSGKSNSDPSSLEFYAYALDALSWGHFNNSNAPNNLTQTQLIQIYTCDPSTGAPYISDWSQVGGTAGTIIKYAPVTTSATYTFFNSKLLNGGTVDSGCDNNHKSTFIEQADGRGVPNANKANAILTYPWSSWRAQGSGVQADLRNGAVLGSINGTAPTPASVTTGTPRFLGTRYMFNILKNTSAAYNPALRYLGVDATGNGYLCSGRASRAIVLYGFVPLPFAVAGSGLPSSYCRLNPPSL